MFLKDDMDIKKTCDEPGIKNTHNMPMFPGFSTHGTPLTSVWCLCMDHSSLPTPLSLPLLASLKSHQIRPSQNPAAVKPMSYIN